MKVKTGAKMNKKEYISYTATKHGVSEEYLSDAYEMLLDGACDVVKQGKKLSLMGFGSLYLQKHKGHPVQFESSSTTVKDYVVLKFSASNAINQQMREYHANGEAIAVNEYEEEKPKKKSVKKEKKK